MDKYRLLAELLNNRGRDKEVFFPASFVSSEGNTCTVDVGNGLKLSDVRLRPTTTGTTNKVLLTPSAGSGVLVGSMSGDYNNLFVLSADEVDSIEITCNGQNVMKLISDLIGVFSSTFNITTTQGPGTGTFDPAVITQLKSIETAFKQIFK